MRRVAGTGTTAVYDNDNILVDGFHNFRSYRPVYLFRIRMDAMMVEYDATNGTISRGDISVPGVATAATSGTVAVSSH